MRSRIASFSGWGRGRLWTSSRALRIAAKRHGSRPVWGRNRGVAPEDTAAAVSFTPSGGESSTPTSSVRRKSCRQKSELLSAKRTTRTSLVWERPPPGSSTLTKRRRDSLARWYWSVERGTAHFSERPDSDRWTKPSRSQFAARCQYKRLTPGRCPERMTGLRRPGTGEVVGPELVGSRESLRHCFVAFIPSGFYVRQPGPLVKRAGLARSPKRQGEADR